MRDFTHRANRQGDSLAAVRMTSEEYRRCAADNRTRPQTTVPPPATAGPVPVMVHAPAPGIGVPPSRPHVVLPPVAAPVREHDEPPRVAWDPYGGGGAPHIGGGGAPAVLMQEELKEESEDTSGEPDHGIGNTPKMMASSTKAMPAPVPKKRSLATASSSSASSAQSPVTPPRKVCHVLYVHPYIQRHELPVVCTCTMRDHPPGP